jgi:hypothetical protein
MGLLAAEAKAVLGGVSLGDQAWVVERHDGRWQITVDNVLPDDQ